MFSSIQFKHFYFVPLFLAIDSQTHSDFVVSFFFVCLSTFSSSYFLSKLIQILKILISSNTILSTQICFIHIKHVHNFPFNIIDIQLINFYIDEEETKKLSDIFRLCVLSNKKETYERNVQKKKETPTTIHRPFSSIQLLDCRFYSTSTVAHTTNTHTHTDANE